MASPAPALAKLKAQLHAKWPTMHTADLGIMGDAAHQKTPSDHNQGDALDIPTVLPMREMEALRALLAADDRVHYTILNHKFYHDGRPVTAYTGSDPHTSHIHLSIYPAKRADAHAWIIAAPVKAAPAAVEKHVTATANGGHPVSAALYRADLKTVIATLPHGTPFTVLGAAKRGFTPGRAHLSGDTKVGWAESAHIG